MSDDPQGATIRVAVCTNRELAAVAPCLDALAREGADVLVVVSGPPRGDFPRALHELRPGLSLARNRALAECADADVLAFVDDDAIVVPGWLGALRAAWADAGERAAVVGGPILPRFPAGRPAWLSDALLPALTVLDHGPEPLVLDPAVTTVYGANVSFRAGPLRAIGGFDPDFGHAGDRVGFAEEDEAERALHAAGWEIRYDPRPRVWHVIGPERTRLALVARRRFVYGRVLGRRGARSRGPALRAAARGAVGAPLAALRGDRVRAAERLVRTAENIGAILR
jgi:glycosyltransferase involved in cell wall biosynthesis